MAHYTTLKNLSIFFCSCFFIISNAQASDLQNAKLFLPDSFVYNQVDEQASFPGGISELKKFITNNIHLPEIIKSGSNTGKVVLRLTISGKGEITNITIQKGFENCKECEDEAIRIVKAMPNWIPAKVGTSTVRSTAVVPINFKTETPL